MKEDKTLDILHKCQSRISGIIICVMLLCGCSPEAPVIDNPMLLRGGKAGRLWRLNETEKGFQYLWFDQLGRCIVLNYEDITYEPEFIMLDEIDSLHTDSCEVWSVLLDGIPYRMTQINTGQIVNSEDTGEPFPYIIRAFVPEDGKMEWYRGAKAAQYDIRTDSMYWWHLELPPSFIPDESHPLNGRWESLSDSLIMLNGQSYRMVEKTIYKYLRALNEEEDEDEDKKIPLDSKRWLILYNTETGDSIPLMDARMPPYDIEPYNAMYIADRTRYEKWMKKWGKNIKSSMLLKGEQFKLYQCVVMDDALYPYINAYYPVGGNYAYYDSSGVRTFVHLNGHGEFSATHFDFKSLWYQKRNKIGTYSSGEEIITKVSSSGDTIFIRGNYGDEDYEFLYIDTKLPLLKKRR